MRGAHYSMPISLENYQLSTPLSFIFILNLSPNIKLDARNSHYCVSPLSLTGTASSG